MYQMDKKKRIDFLKYIDNELDYDLYGRENKFNLKCYKGPLPFMEKYKGLQDYKYTIAFENCQELGYYTEKITDAILMECLCFYWGCPNISQYIDTNAYIWLDIDNKEESLNKIKNTIQNNEWEKRINIIRKEKKRIMTKTQILPHIERIINNQDVPEIPTYIINLDRREDRWEKVHKKLLDSNIVCFERYSAFDGQKLVWDDTMKKLFEIDDDKPRNKTHDYRRGILGCSLSHYTLWKKMVKDTKSDDEIWIILEDDINFVPDFANQWSKLYPKLKKDKSWGLFFFSFNDSHIDYGDEYIFNGDTSIRLFGNQLRNYGAGAYGYAIRRWAANELIEIAKKERIQRQIDWFMFDNFSKIRSYWSDPNLVSTLSSAYTSDTDIQNSFDRVI